MDASGLGGGLPRDSKVLREYGNQHFHQKQLITASYYYTEAFRTASSIIDKVLAISNRAEVALAVASYDSAIADAETAIQLWSGHAKAWLRKARALSKLQQHRKAVETTETAMKLGSPGLVKQLSKYRETFLRLQQQSEDPAEYDLLEWRYLQYGLQPEETSDYVGPVLISSSSIGGNGLLAERNITRGELLIVSNGIVITNGNYSRDELTRLLSMKCRGNGRLLSQFEGTDIRFYRPNSGHFPGPSFHFSTLTDLVDTKVMIKEGWYGMWGLPALMNHSCLPNSDIVRIGDVLLVRATRDIQAHEEVFCSYIDPFLPVEESRCISEKHHIPDGKSSCFPTGRVTEEVLRKLQATAPCRFAVLAAAYASGCSVEDMPNVYKSHFSGTLNKNPRTLKLEDHGTTTMAVDDLENGVRYLCAEELVSSSSNDSKKSRKPKIWRISGKWYVAIAGNAAFGEVMLLSSLLALREKYGAEYNVPQIQECCEEQFHIFNTLFEGWAENGNYWSASFNFVSRDDRRAMFTMMTLRLGNEYDHNFLKDKENELLVSGSGGEFAVAAYESSKKRGIKRIARSFSYSAFMDPNSGGHFDALVIKQDDTGNQRIVDVLVESFLGDWTMIMPHQNHCLVSPSETEQRKASVEKLYRSTNDELILDRSKLLDEIPKVKKKIKDKESATKCEIIKDITVHKQWISPSVSGPRPVARYEHASSVIGQRMFVIGGNHNGRYLSTVQVLDLTTLTWSKLEMGLNMIAPCAGHSLIRKNNLLLVYSKENPSETITVHVLDVETSAWSVLPTYGHTPAARRGQSVSLVGSSLVMFGGEDYKHRLLSDVNILDLDTMTWKSYNPMGVAPQPRSNHAAAVYSGRYMEWSRKETSIVLRARSGHAGATVGNLWYIVGGGDIKGGVPETIVLNMETLECETLASETLAYEGLSLISTVVNNEETLVAFGGYNGGYSNETHVFKATSRVASLNDDALDTSGTMYAELENDRAMDHNTRKMHHNTRKMQATLENQELSKELQSVRHQLLAEQSRSSKLEDENAKLKRKLQGIPV